MPLNRKAYRSDLTDQEWNRIKRLLPKPAATSRPRVDDREVVNGILYVTWTGCRWDDLRMILPRHRRPVIGAYSNISAWASGTRSGAI